jgi:hypothetical protein
MDTAMQSCEVRKSVGMLGQVQGLMGMSDVHGTGAWPCIIMNTPNAKSISQRAGVMVYNMGGGSRPVVTDLVKRGRQVWHDVIRGLKQVIYLQ